LASGALLVAPFSGWTEPPPRGEQAKPVEEHTELIGGLVKKKDSEKKILVLSTAQGDRNLAVNDRTTYMKGGLPAKAGDVDVGVRVIAKTRKGTDGALEAIEIRILGAESAPETQRSPRL
jgi:hypothetical protein